MTAEASPRPWRVHYGAEIWDANGDMVYNLNGFNHGNVDKKNAALIVAAVNERDLIATRLEAIDKRLDEAVAIHDALEAERDRLCDALNEVCRRASVALNCPRKEEEAIDLLVHDLLGIKECARSALGEDNE